jgi:hypothetical protein
LVFIGVHSWFKNHETWQRTGGIDFPHCTVIWLSWTDASWRCASPVREPWRPSKTPDALPFTSAPLVGIRRRVENANDRGDVIVVFKNHKIWETINTGGS